MPTIYAILQISKTCPKTTIKTPERHQWRRSGVITANPKHIQHPNSASQSPTPSIQLPAGYLQLKLISTVKLSKYSKQ